MDQKVKEQKPSEAMIELGYRTHNVVGDAIDGLEAILKDSEAEQARIISETELENVDFANIKRAFHNAIASLYGITNAHSLLGKKLAKNGQGKVTNADFIEIAQADGASARTGGRNR